ncbi:alpha/beta-hydrolase [Decorospora gaudefroyi]|uniref:Alpha/beta-hydrolase n=1 Tax=Decorospora gaudefroyi TaxID=184978 RepID=A0A6A5K403_9PLEO|nr:alpha/beta-hydrolase [Decorospora gaudefroyi]
MAAPAPPEGLPLDDRSNALKIPIITLIVFSSTFVGLRLGVSWKNRNYFLLTDHLLWTGCILAVAGAACCYKMADLGAGRHVWDPFITPDKLRQYLYYLWVGQLLNLYGMALVKLSVCAYIFMLDFSKAFRIIIWMSVVLHIGINFVFPSIILFGECTPYSKHWDVAGTQPGSCWSATPRVISGYSGAATNILTDLLYTMAPLIYIARVQLPKRTIWGVRAVFLLGLITTTISALKLYEMKALYDSPDPTYTSVNLSIFAIAEVFVGAFTASLPPLRKTFETQLHKVLPASLTGGSTKNSRQSYALQDRGSHPSATRPKHELDDNSECGILPEDASTTEGKGSDQAIMKTTDMSPPKPSQPYNLDLHFRGFAQGLTYLDPTNSQKPLCHFFGGVPYALPPTRFQKPRPLPACYRYGTRADPGVFTAGCGVCPQEGVGDGEEDCLQCNIWVPVGEGPEKGWPVLFWIHGGFLQWGTPNTLDARALLSTSPTRCIIVAPAYRLNIFGFHASSTLLASNPDSYTVNLGFWDQRLALQWTHENINYWGGNSANLTLAGYSAGSHSVFHQLSYDLGLPDSKAVVRRAIMWSNGPGVQPKSMHEAETQSSELCDVLGIPEDVGPQQKLDALRRVDAGKLVEVASRKMSRHQFRAVTDGEFVRYDLIKEVSTGVYARRMKSRNIQLLVGECANEHFVYGTWRPPLRPSYDALLHRLEADYPQEACSILMQHYFENSRDLGPRFTSWEEAFGRVYADVQIHALCRGMVYELVRHGAGDLVFRYRIEWRARCVDNDLPTHYGATHGSDMAIWFWGNGRALGEEEKSVVGRAFQEPLSRFLRGEEMEWGARDAMHVRTLKNDGRVAVEEDTRLKEGLRLWDKLKEVGATGDHKEMAKL